VEPAVPCRPPDIPQPAVGGQSLTAAPKEWKPVLEPHVCSQIDQEDYFATVGEIFESVKSNLLGCPLVALNQSTPGKLVARSDSVNRA